MQNSLINTCTYLTYMIDISTNLKPLSLGLLRSDLMLESKCSTAKKIEDCSCNRPYCCWKQVEINTIASGFGHLGPISREIQRCILINYFISTLHTKQISKYLNAFFFFKYIS